MPSLKKNLGPIVLALAGLGLGVLPISAYAVPGQPVIISPTGGLFGPTVTMTGTADVGMTINLFEGGVCSTAPWNLPPCRGRGVVDGSGHWSIVMKNLPSGHRNISAVAIDRTGLAATDPDPVAQTSPAVSTTFDVDSLRPSLTVDQDPQTVFLPGDDYTFSGTASDLVAGGVVSGVVKVSVQLFNLRGDPMGAPTIAACPACGPGATSVTWSVHPPKPAVGAYSVQMTAIDGVGNKSVPQEPGVSTQYGIRTDYAGAVVFVFLDPDAPTPPLPEVSPPPVPDASPPPVPDVSPPAVPSPDPSPSIPAP